MNTNNDEINLNARRLLFNLLKAHAEMELKPDYFSKDNPTKQSYYGLLNRTLELIEKGLQNEQQ